MRLGTRWQAGTTPPAALPEELLPAIAEWEREHPEALSWTLTWLEGRPRCALDEVGVLALDSAGDVIAEGDAEDADDDWLK